MKKILSLVIVGILIMMLLTSTVLPALSIINNEKTIKKTLEDITWEWAKGGGGYSIDYGKDVTVDIDGNVYVIGKYFRFATFGNTTLTSYGPLDSWDIFVAKLNKNGEWLWVVGAGGTLNDEGAGIAVDEDGNVYITGVFYDVAWFGNTTLNSLGGLDVYVAKIDTNGNWLWAIRGGGYVGEAGYGIAVDSIGNIYVTGHFMFTATFGNTTLTSQGSADVFVTKLDTDGNWLWAVSGGGSLPDYVYDIAIDSNGNVCLTGDFEGSATFGTDTITSQGDVDVFITKLDTDGNWLWAKSGGSVSIERGYDIAIDNNGNIYITGVFLISITFGTTTLTSEGSWDVYVLKLNTNGDWQWAVRGGSSSTEGAWGIAVDSSGNPFITGVFDGFVTFGESTISSQGARDIFIAKLDFDGNWKWAKSAGGANWDEGYSIKVDKNGYVFATGYFDISATFGSTTLTSEGDYDVFITKLSYEGVNLPPIAPRIDGPNNGKPGISYEYTFKSTDPESNDIAEYIVNWGDGPDEIIRGPFKSGSPATKSHVWNAQGKYIIKAQAKDIQGAESDWATFEVNMPRNKVLQNSLFLRLLERFPFVFAILRLFFGLSRT